MQIYKKGPFVYVFMLQLRMYQINKNNVYMCFVKEYWCKFELQANHIFLVCKMHMY